MVNILQWTSLTSLILLFIPLLLFLLCPRRSLPLSCVVRRGANMRPLPNLRQLPPKNPPPATSATARLARPPPVQQQKLKRIFIVKSLLMKELKILLILKKKMHQKALKLLSQNLLERQHCQVFSSSVTSATMKVLLTKELGNTLE